MEQDRCYGRRARSCARMAFLKFRYYIKVRVQALDDLLHITTITRCSPGLEYEVILARSFVIYDNLQLNTGFIFQFNLRFRFSTLHFVLVHP